MSGADSELLLMQVTFEFYSVHVDASISRVENRDHLRNVVFL